MVLPVDTKKRTKKSSALRRGLTIAIVVLVPMLFANKVLQEHKFLSSDALDLPDDEKSSTMLIAELKNQLQDAKDELKAARKDVDQQGAGGSTSATTEVELFPFKGSIYEKGFNPILIYSNPTTAAAEIPKQPNYSQEKVCQDKIIVALIEKLQKKQQGGGQPQPFFVDLAANHAIELSNTLLLEQNGWKGLCIEGNPEYWYDLARYRKCTIVGAFVGGKENEDGKQVQVALKGASGGIVGKGMDNKEASDVNVNVNRDLVSILTVFKETRVPNMIDYFSLDVEGAETLVMKDFPWNEYSFRFITIERPKDDLKTILVAQGYVYVGLLIWWGETLWMHEKYAGISLDEVKYIVKEELARDVNTSNINA